MEWIEIVYLICFFLGLGFALISGLLSGVFGGGDAHVDAGGHDAHVGDIHFSPLSPVVIAMFVASFGGAGLILKRVGLPLYGHIPLAALSGLVVGAIVFYFFWKIFSTAQASSEAHVDELVGTEAEVTTPIPANGVGEITYIVKQQRYSAPARAMDNREIPTRAVVRIAKIVSNTYYVERTA